MVPVYHLTAKETEPEHATTVIPPEPTAALLELIMQPVYSYIIMVQLITPLVFTDPEQAL
jgi:hypothetical protein